MSDRPAILLFDGSCGFCARNVQFVLAHERKRHSLQFASLASSVGDALRRNHPELECIDSVIWYEPAHAGQPEVLLVRSAAALRVSRYLGGLWSVVGRIVSIIPRFVRDAGYDFIARHRHQIIRGDASCLLPTPEQRARFLEWERMGAV
jgi:predicted DCC family thiol-disulfide oxidoreductase YuxK